MHMGGVMLNESADSVERWPSLPLEAWEDTRATLHMWTQIVGKVRLACTPLVNHWWNVPLYLTSRGLTTSPIAHGHRTFQLDLDLLGHQLLASDSDGRQQAMPLGPGSVAGFYRQLMGLLDQLGLGVRIWPMPVEVEDPIAFEDDTAHRAYDPEHANRFWRILVQADRVFQQFRAGFLGKASPVHFFWGSFDLAASRFSGRPAPPHPGAPHVADAITREAYSHEVSSAGFWPGGGAFPRPAFYAYAYPEPPGFRDWPVQPDGAFYSADLGEFLLPYDAVRTASDPDQALLAFLHTSYDAAAESGGWDRAVLERPVRDDSRQPTPDRWTADS
jgi:hypothetical protein